MGTFDCAAWHPIAANRGGTHIAMFVGWAITRDLIARTHLEQPSSAWYVARIKARERTARDFLADLCRDRLTEADLSREGCEFATAYYSERYLVDYSRVFPDTPSVYDVDDTLANLERISTILDRRLAQFRRWLERREVELREVG